MIPGVGSPAVNGAAVVSSWILFGGCSDDPGGGVVALSLDSVWLSLPDDCGAVVALPSMIPGVDSWAVAVALSMIQA